MKAKKYTGEQIVAKLLVRNHETGRKMKPKQHFTKQQFTIRTP
jgi:hypothetical protein